MSRKIYNNRDKGGAYMSNGIYSEIKKRIELSDAILVVDINNYIGNSTNLEIDYAKKLCKEIIYYTDLIKNKQNNKLQVVVMISLK